jgi:4-carboxymuconolactone decarboxylase
MRCIHEKQTAGRNALGDLAPKFAELNDDVLFGEVWSREDKLALRDRTIITVVALVTKGITDSSFKYHLQNAKNHGVTKPEMVEIITQLAFYVGWPNAWAVFPLVREIYAEEKVDASDSLFGLGAPNEKYAHYFIGNSYVKVLNTNGVFLVNVTFEPGCRNNWHIHHNGGQVLLCTDGGGWYQEWDHPARKLHPGDVVYIALEVKHWHGASTDSWFSHVSIEIPAEERSNEWFEPVAEGEYGELR